MAKRIERSPIASALEATAVFIESTEINTPEQTEIAVIKYFFKFETSAPRFNSFLMPEQMPSAKKQFERGIKIFCEIKFKI